MTESESNNIFVFRERAHLFGVLVDDFESHLPLNRVWVSHNTEDSPFWQFEDQRTSQKGHFIHPATLFGFENLSFSESSVLFLNTQSEKLKVGVLMNEFLMKLINKKSVNRALAVDLVKNFPPALPKTAFKFVHRFKRNNIYVLNPEGLLKEFNLTWPESI